MSGRGRSLFRMILRDFLASIKPTINRPKLMGEDYFGTKYYEVAVKDSSKKKLPSRYFESINDDFEQEIPAEWESWLRHRKKEPPTYEEIVANYKIAMTKKTNALNKLKSDNKEKLALNESNMSVKKSGNGSSFPTYEEYSSSTDKYNGQTSTPKS